MKKIFWIIFSFLLTFGLIYACGGGGGGGNAANGTVSLFATDDISDYRQVTATITKVQLVHTGTGLTCDVLKDPQIIDIANLAGVLHMLDVSQCSSGPYNRIHIEFDKTVELMDKYNTPATCSFTSYKDDDFKPGHQPKQLQCDPNSGICTLDINGAVNVLANQYTNLALDFNLKEFDVEYFGQQNCTVTMKVSPLHASDIDDLKAHQGYKEGVTGYVSDLNTGVKTFTLKTKKGITFIVDYSQASYSNNPQPGIDDLLDFAAKNMLKVRVMSDNIDFVNSAIMAATIYVKVEGMVKNLSGNSFTLGNTAKGISISIDYSDAAAHAHVDGTLQNDTWVEVKLFGYDSVTIKYLAHEVEVEESSSMGTDD